MQSVFLERKPFQRVKVCFKRSTFLVLGIFSRKISLHYNLILYAKRSESGHEISCLFFNWVGKWTIFASTGQSGFEGLDDTPLLQATLECPPPHSSKRSIPSYEFAFLLPCFLSMSPLFCPLFMNPSCENIKCGWGTGIALQRSSL